MEQRKPKYPRFYLPTYPFWKSLHRSNAQVRHDRGGVTAGMQAPIMIINRIVLLMSKGSYFRSFSDIAELIQKIKSSDFQPLPRDNSASYASMTATELEDESTSNKTQFRHELWAILHGLQGFETRFGLKTAIVTSLLAIPAWLKRHTEWWNQYEVWWAVVMAWVIMGPR